MNLINIVCQYLNLTKGFRRKLMKRIFFQLFLLFCRKVSKIIKNKHDNERILNSNSNKTKS
jgi:hypothetical protein